MLVRFNGLEAGMGITIKEYNTHWPNVRYLYEEFLRKYNMRHIEIKPETFRINRAVERLKHILLENFYQLAFIRKDYSYLNDL